MELRIGTAGWSIPLKFKNYFSDKESQLVNYSQIFNSVEINSTFSKIHKPSTFEKWASQTPENFEFSLKLHRSFTHENELKPKAADLKKKLLMMGNLGKKWKVLLLQFPGKQEFHERKMGNFYENIRRYYEGAIVLEPRNLSWLSKESKAFMKEFKISKVMADPERCPHSTKNILSTGGITYIRLHGSPIIYRSSYANNFIKKLHQELSSYKNPWCIFDNTALGEGTGNALTLRSMT